MEKKTLPGAAARASSAAAGCPPAVAAGSPHQYPRGLGEPVFENILAYVAFAGFVREADRACGVSRSVWATDVQLRWITVKARHGRRRLTRLHHACGLGRLPRALELLEWGSELGALDTLGWSPLFWAIARGGNVELVRELVLRSPPGTVAALRDVNGFMPLHFAALNGHADVVRYLLAECGADVEAASGAAAGGLAALGFAVEQHAETSDAARKQAVVRELVAAGARLDARNARGLTPLASACRTGRGLVAALLVESGADVNLGDEGGCAPLHYACDRDGSAACVRALLGRAETAAGARTNGGLTPLLIASHASRVDCMRALLEDRDVDEVDIDAGDDGNDGASALHIAVRRSDESATLLLLSFGADANLRDAAGRAPLHLAADAGVARLLLLAPRACVNAVDAQGCTALHRAARLKQGPLVAALLERADIDVTMLDAQGKNALDLLGPKDEEMAAAILSRLPPNLAAAAAEKRQRAAQAAEK